MASENKAKIGVVGAGVIGLTSALSLVEAGHTVTIVARNLPGDLTTEWASPWAAALLAPHPDARHDFQEESLKRWHALLEQNPECGMREVDVTEFYDDRDSISDIWYRKLYPEMREIPKEDLVFEAKIGFKYRCLMVDPNVFLPWIFARLNHAGVQFMRREISSLRELKDITGADILINASGLGARELASDSNVHAIRGQTMLISCPDEYDPLYKEAFIFQGSHYTYALPRKTSGGMILGGVSQAHNESAAVDPELRPDFLKRANTLTRGLYDWVDLKKDIRRDIVGFRPARTGGARVERVGQIVHAYGVAGLGYVLAFGVAAEVVRLVQGPGQPKL